MYKLHYTTDTNTTGVNSYSRIFNTRDQAVTHALQKMIDDSRINIDLEKKYYDDGYELEVSTDQLLLSDGEDQYHAQFEEVKITRYLVIVADYYASNAVYSYGPYNNMEDAKSKLKECYNDDKKGLEGELFESGYRLSNEYRDINVIISEITL